MAEIRVAIVEDEPPARAKLKRMLGEHPGYRVVAEADDVAGAVAAIRDEKPDPVSLNIRLGAGGVLEVRARAAPPYPLIVFTTAYHEHALRAFEFAALDYLLKPFDRERFDKAMQRVGERLLERGAGEGAMFDDERLRHAQALARTPPLTRLIAHERGRSVIVALA